MRGGVFRAIKQSLLPDPQKEKRRNCFGYAFLPSFRTSIIAALLAKGLQSKSIGEIDSSDPENLESSSLVELEAR
ncbi:hypothetical protein COLO4_03963 [Corchorus olitorius]|uniref:Uncharacterized protein n=1 Tax=Corchorus olitorius TaxID=93759 RepID=A0A1R3KVP7_9ROSI|nr:hypothetical protein COLO4_03963 [Corchorus olitorius]